MLGLSWCGPPTPGKLDSGNTRKRPEVRLTSSLLDISTHEMAFNEMRLDLWDKSCCQPQLFMFICGTSRIHTASTLLFEIYGMELIFKFLWNIGNSLYSISKQQYPGERKRGKWGKSRKVKIRGNRGRRWADASSPEQTQKSGTQMKFSVPSIRRYVGKLFSKYLQN